MNETQILVLVFGTPTFDFFFGVDDRGFLKEGIKIYQMASVSFLNSSTCSPFCLYIYSLCSTAGKGIVV